jgi:flavin-dependent dehydrogenase
VHDVAVLGGGPAGSATALELARRGRDVVLLERSRFDGPRFGETLPPQINPLLRRLGAWDVFLACGPLESPGTISAWGSPFADETDFVANPHGNGWHVDRNAFDAALCELAARAGVRVCVGTAVSSCRRDAEDGTWTVSTANAQVGSLRARFVVDATGRNGVRLKRRTGASSTTRSSRYSSTSRTTTVRRRSCARASRRPPTAGGTVRRFQTAAASRRSSSSPISTSSKASDWASNCAPRR